MKKILTPLLVSLWLAVNLPVLQAADLPVPGQFSSIQAAINAANSGDRVIVSPGTYNENITLKSGVTVQGCGPDACIIQGNGTTATVFGNQLTAATTIDGFTITGGAGFTVPWSENRIMGGGIFADASIINIGHNRIVSNQAQIGGGIALMNSRFNIVANTISSNQATTPNLSSFNIGGGVYLLDSTGQLSQNDILSNTVSSGPSNPTRVDDSANLAPGGGIAVVFSIPMGDIKILSNRVSGNATSGSQNYGGGVYLFQSSADLGNRVFLLGNTISENDGLDGGGIAAVLIEPIILGNRFTGNTGHWGGAIYGFSGGGIIAHNVVDGNSSIEIRQGVNTGGGGILCDQDFTPFMAHNTFQNNTAKDYGGAVEVFDSGSSAVLWKNLFEGNSARFGGGVVVSAASPDIVGNYFSNNNATTESGGGLFVERTTGVSVANNIFSSNSAGRFGGGVALVDAGQTAFSNNTLYANTAAPAWWGGGLYMFNGSLSFQNNIVSRNGTYGVGLDGAGTMQRQYDDFFANSGENCFRCPPGTGEIVADPRFTDTIGFRLNASSPNVNAGNPDPAFNDPDGSRNDIGAYGGARAGDIPLPSGASGSKPSFDSSTSILSLPNTDLAVGGNRVSLQMKLTSCASAPGVVALKLQSFSAASELDAARGAFYRSPYLVVREATVGGRDYDAVLSLYSCASDPDGVYGKLEALAASL